MFDSVQNNLLPEAIVVFLSSPGERNAGDELSAHRPAPGSRLLIAGDEFYAGTSRPRQRFECVCPGEILVHMNDTKVRRDIIVIGAAMGGLSAVCKLLGALPSFLDVAILIVLDIGSQPASVVLQILRTYCHFQVDYADHNALVNPGRVLLAPPNHNMRIGPSGTIALERESAYAGNGSSVDLLFKTAAAAYGPRVIGVVLSGGSHDGTAGLTWIEAAGGVGVVQDPAEAADGSMPANAIRQDHPDYCSPVRDMAALLVSLAAGDKPSKGVRRV